ncbi:hypothetical protein PR202_ga18103 [Eleusine coracana subsp. coracana]|uniref:Uncharacterized protein n=1 Tax=Eleusine coracana subsp. coracana TaxID=191504 RepID=A0AAV5CRL9_ELECO|nr:hypothetical protein PR202_ga18103 [Eleusine coracana subsp. coracana]
MAQQQLRVLDTVRLSPAVPVPPQPLPLSGLDADRNTDPLAVLPRAFEAALALFPAFRRPPPPPLRILLRLPRRRPAAPAAADLAVPFVLAECDLPAADVDTDSPDSPLLDRLAPGVQDDAGAARASLLALQATRFACGGVALGMRAAHGLCDGAGATQFLAAAARFARGQGPPLVVPVWDRRELLGPRRPPRVVTPLFDRVLAVDDGHHHHQHPEQEQEITRACFHVSDARVEALRARLADEAGLRLTTFEVVAAFVWRARVKANGTGAGETVKMVYSMNISKLLTPPLPAGYWGNVCVPVYVCLPAGDLVSQPLAATAALIKKSKQHVDDEYVRSYIDFQELHHLEGVTAGGEVSAFTDWRRLGHGEVDFGWGGPDVVVPLTWGILGSTEPCFFLPYGVNDERRKGGFKVFVAVRGEAMPVFREEMAELLVQQHQITSVGKL